MLKKIYAVPALGMTLLASQAHAEVGAGVTAAITEAVTDVGVIGAAILLVVVAVAGFNWLRKPVH